MAGEKYNGWTNYETWNVNLWLGDDSELEELVENAGNVWDGADAIKNHVDGLLEDSYGELATGASMFTDLMRHALDSVNWRELAEHHKPDEWGDADEAPAETEDEEDEELTVCGHEGCDREYTFSGAYDKRGMWYCSEHKAEVPEHMRMPRLYQY